MNSFRYAVVGLAAAAVLVLAVGTISGSMAAMNKTDTDLPSVAYKENMRYRDYQDGVFKVRAGAGSHIAPLTKFYPYKAEINVGETVVWYNPTRVSEPHTVTFVSDPNYWADIVAPFVLPSTTPPTPAIPGANADAVVMPGPNGTSILIGANARSLNPAVVSSSGDVTYLSPNANYTMGGGEKYLNSGWVWPQGLAPEGLPPIDTFAVKFEEPGTYNYICSIHPWMTGVVVVS